MIFATCSGVSFCAGAFGAAFGGGCVAAVPASPAAITSPAAHP
jgi:hypothetical protein